MIVLEQRNTQAAERLELSLRLSPFGDDADTEIIRHIADIADDDLTWLVLIDLPDQLHIQLELIRL